MKASKEVRSWFNKIRSKYGRRNGVIPACVLDAPRIEIKIAKNKRLVK